MTNYEKHETILRRPASLLFFLFTCLLSDSEVHGFATYSSFAVKKIGSPSATITSKYSRVSPVPQNKAVELCSLLRRNHVSSSSSILKMNENDNEGSGLVTTLVLVFIILVFVVSGVAPMLQAVSPSGGAADMNLGDAVATRQVDGGISSMKNINGGGFEKLSRTKIQQKLNRVPVFFLSDKKDGQMLENIYLSYDDAFSAANELNGISVKCTTLDQVMYPLVLKRGRMRMAPPPSEIQKAEEEASAEEGTTKKFRLVPSSAAVKDASSLSMTLADGDIPLFVADRLAFASPEGPQVPLFLTKADVITSYNRLRESKGSRLPEEPTIRSSTLFDELFSMEKGTRPAVSQLQFYATNDDLLRASEML
mmetsp:Transcript_14048/g.20515  ORF Transcript_14048/g.20515 Transcript_14048/m.20515 type:complete len:366 (+) Transcript_14048:589-1686(+)|eukprot:CAMPEP_0195521776 /NCGR_PEP_ID=MMETSP0794_2-20130614/19323_1 /TAXON_ID=515487 /ORGANISM="Stephanopyxis turris, Strain CCMP 815" /LENGTH=365 /DNA_ID=CAMNT_0040651395 /DNA_START=588 /DNA_END=1685 /DNA_ORIENTATION=-